MLLKVKRKEKAAADQKAQQANIQAQANANAEASERAALAEMQKQQALAQTELQIEQGKSQFAIKKLEQEAAIKRQLMELQHSYDMELKQMEVNRMAEKEKLIEDRKDKRTRQEGTQRSQLINQKQNDLLPTDFNDNEVVE